MLVVKQAIVSLCKFYDSKIYGCKKVDYVEVDFYVSHEGLAIQASFDMTETWEREVSALATLHKAFPLQRALIVTRDTESQIKYNRLSIEVIPIWKWLLL